MKKSILSLTVIGALSIPAFCSEFITIGTGGVTGVYYPTGGAICRMVNKMKKDTGIRCSVESTGGSVYNVNTIRAGELDFGISQSDIAYQAYNGTGKYEKNAFKDVRSVMAIYPELLTLVVRKEAGITSLKDINGKKINIGDPGSGQRATVEELFDISGGEIGRDKLKLAQELKAAEAPDALRDNKIDGYFYFVGHPNANIKDAANSINIDIVDLTPQNSKAVAKLLKANSYYGMGTIPVGTYKGINRDVKSFGVKAVLLTSAKVSDKAVETLTKAILDNFDDFKKLHPAYATITKEELLEGLGAPMHPAAIKVFKEKGFLK